MSFLNFLSRLVSKLSESNDDPSATSIIRPKYKPHLLRRYRP
jgi:hypothetical protein